MPCAALPCHDPPSAPAPPPSSSPLPHPYRRGGGWQEMWHTKIVPHFAVVFKDRSHVLALTRSVHMFSPLQGSEGLNCWGHRVFTLNPVSQVSCGESRWLSCRSTTLPNYNSSGRILHFPLFGKFVPHCPTVFKVLYQNFPLTEFCLTKICPHQPPPPPPPGSPNP